MKALLSLVALLMATVPSALAQPTREYQVKAVLLFNFAEFTEWPAQAFAQPDSPLVIGTFGGNPFGEFLKDTVREEVVSGHRVKIEHFNSLAELTNCHILYINQSEANRMEEIVNALKGKPVLTVGDFDASSRPGLMIRLAIEKGKIKLKVNQEAARAAGLILSSKLLRSAEVVAPGKK